MFFQFSKLILLCGFFATSTATEKTTVFKTRKDQQEWLQDSIGCNGIRLSLESDVIRAVRTMRYNDVILELGKPYRESRSDDEKMKDCFYLIKSHCDTSNSSSGKLLELIIHFENDSVTSASDNVCGG